MQLSGIDLNLLVVLDALLQTRSVKAAASRVALSPSATSHALNRLRDLFGDELLVRAGRSMVLSARAEQLRPAVHDALEAVEGVFSVGDEVDPSSLRRRFDVVTTDYGEVEIVQEVGRVLHEVAPGVDLLCRRPDKPVLDELRDGAADVAIGVYRETPPDIRKVGLIDERFVCLVRNDHPVLKEGLDLDAYCALEHVLSAPGGRPGGIVDRYLAELGRERRVARLVASFLAAPHVVQGTDYIVTIAARVADRYARLLDLAVVEPPLELPGYTIDLVWHRRSDRDPAHVWLREAFVGVGVG